MPTDLYLISFLNSIFKLVLLLKGLKKQEIIKMLWIVSRVKIKLIHQPQYLMMRNGGTSGISEM
jgi:hypothetical protein